MSFGVLSTGFSKKTRQDILDEINASVKADIDPNLNTESTSILGQIIGIMADQLSQNWNVMEDTYDSQYPDSAAEASLDNVSSITGTERLAATESTATLIVTGDNATVLPLGRQARVAAGGIFATDANVTINTATAWVNTTAYSVGDLRRNDTPDNIYVCITAGTSAGAGGPTGTGTAIVDGTVTWRYVGLGAGYNTVAVTCTETGVVAAQAYQITEIVTAVSGWKGVNNLADATTGTEEETDPALRARRETRLASGGRATIEAVRSALLVTTGVTNAFVFENTTDVTNGDGLPPHSIQGTVVGGADADIAQTLFDNKAAGIATYGIDISEAIVDSQGISHTILADRADTMEIWIAVTVITDGDYPADGDTQVGVALAAFGDELTIGEDVIFTQFAAASLESCGGVSGVVDIQSFVMDKQPVVVTAGNAETYALSNGETLTVRVDGQSVAQTVTFNTGDFVDINNATAAEVATVVSADLTTPAATGGVSATKTTITSDSGGSVRVTGGTANGALGFPTTHTPVGTANIAISNRQIAALDTTRIAVTSV